MIGQFGVGDGGLAFQSVHILLLTGTRRSRSLLVQETIHERVNATHKEARHRCDLAERLRATRRQFLKPTEVG